VNHLCAVGLLAVLLGCDVPPEPKDGKDTKEAKDAKGAEKGPNPVVEIKTNKGTIKVELFKDKAPKTVANYLSYVEKKHYDGTIFHRVIPTFMIQGGGLTTELKEKKAGKPIMNEADNGLSNKRGTIAMARTSEPHSATAQFFINVKDNTPLDHTSKDEEGWGYCVFGKVISGMDVVDKIKAVKTGAKGPFRKDAPQENVVIESVRVIKKK
jgi:cyclophilin family peptidyl-prolyl cis-trans isomerase